MLSTRHGLHVQYIYVQLAEARNFVSRNPSSGTLRPICRSAAGIAMLTRERDDHIDLIARGAAALDGRPVAIPTLRARIDEARRVGFAWQIDSNIRGVGDVAVLLDELDPFGQALVLSIGAASDVLERDYQRIGRLLSRLASEFCAR